jgi:hypothetical protein
MPGGAVVVSMVNGVWLPKVPASTTKLLAHTADWADT